MEMENERMRSILESTWTIGEVDSQENSFRSIIRVTLIAMSRKLNAPVTDILEDQQQETLIASRGCVADPAIPVVPVKGLGDGSMEIGDSEHFKGHAQEAQNAHSNMTTRHEVKEKVTSDSEHPVRNDSLLRHQRPAMALGGALLDKQVDLHVLILRRVSGCSARIATTDMLHFEFFDKRK